MKSQIYGKLKFNKNFKLKKFFWMSEEKRKKNFDESIKNGFEEKFGCFGYPPSLAVSDDSLANKIKRKPKLDEEKQPFLSFTTKSGILDDALFEKPGYIANTPAPRLQKQKKEDETVFVPPGQVHFSTNKLGFEYIEEKGEKKYERRDFEKKPVQYNIFSNPLKR